MISWKLWLRPNLVLLWQPTTEADNETDLAADSVSCQEFLWRSAGTTRWLLITKLPHTGWVKRALSLSISYFAVFFNPDVKLGWDNIWAPVSVDDGIEGETVPPWLSEVLDIDSGVLVGRFLGPSQKCFLRRQVLLANNNVRDLKKKRKTISTGNDGNEQKTTTLI